MSTHCGDAQSGYNRLRPKIKPVGPQVMLGAEPTLTYVKRMLSKHSLFQAWRQKWPYGENACSACVFRKRSLLKYFPIQL